MENGGDSSFASCYMELCREQRMRPLPMICVTLPHSLDFTTDRVKMDDWAPILNSLSLDRTLRSISVRSKYQCRKLLEQANSESKARAVGKAPVVLTRFLVEWLSHSLAQCVRNSASLTTLELEGIPVPADCLAVLCVGLAGSNCLQHLSLRRCCIGDEGCELVCRTVAEVRSVRSLNLAQCELTGESGVALASALSRQKLALYHDTWKQSLRYREPKLDSMPGLRRLTLNGNTKLGNEAVSGIIEAVRDSLWFKALDFQQCGLNEDLGQGILELLEHNKTLAIVDVRLNPGFRDETLNEISRRLERNDLHCKSEYRWLNLPQNKESIGSKRVSSAGNLQKAQKQETEAPKAALARPRSAMIRQVKRPPGPIIYRKPLLAPAPQIAKRIKIKPPLPVFERRPRQPMKPPEHARMPQPQPQPEPAPKVSLHLDLQSQIQSLADSTQTGTQPQLEEPLPVKVPLSSTRRPQTAKETSREPDRLQEVLRQLLEAREERDRLQEETRRHELILSEERARREFTEAKLRSAKTDLSDLEESLRQRERDQRGYLLISQKSMEEICLSFGRLLDILEPSDSLARIESEEDSLAREDIKRRFALIIRKTKSENLKRGYFVDDERVLSRLQMTARLGRSEGNIRGNTIEAPPEPPPERLTIGDTAETIGLPQLVSTFREHGFDGIRLDKSGGDSPGDRARAIFASLVNGDALLGFGAHR